MGNLLRIYITSGVTLFLLTGLLGCSGSHNQLSPPPTAIDEPEFREFEALNHSLWGVWRISINPDDLVVEVRPLRNLQAHFNIIDIVTPPECTDCLDIQVNSFDPVTRILDVDVTLRNPYPIAGRDVRGILYTNDYGHELRNADDWTGLWDVLGGMDINPFKAFAKGEVNRTFAGESQHTEKYLVYIPQPPHYNDITFAVDASYPGNCKEPYAIEGPSYVNIYHEAGALAYLELSVFDWHDDITEVTLSASEITGEENTPLTLVADDRWGVEFANILTPAAGDYTGIIKAKSANSGNTTLCDVINIGVRRGWAKTLGGINWDSGYGVAIDGGGNVYITGYFTGTADFDPGPGIDLHTSIGSGDIFLTKFDSSGVFQWSSTWGGAYGVPHLARGVAIGSSGNVYVTGYFAATVDFDPGPGIEEHTSNGWSDVFLSKFDSSGAFQWARTWGGSSDDYGEGVAIDGNDNVYIIGSFKKTVDFDPVSGVDEHTSNGQEDIFLSKFDSSGDFQWAHTWGGIAFDIPYGVAVEGNGSTYVTGNFYVTVDFDPGPGVDEHTSNGFNDIFLSKFDSSGDFQWGRSWGGSSGDEGHGVAIDGSGNVYITGDFLETADFNPGPGVDEHTSNGGWDIFLSKFDSAGDFQWAHTWGGNESDHVTGVAIDGSGNAYAPGYFESTVDFDAGPGVTEHTSNGAYDVFLSKFDSAGVFQWAWTWGGNSYDIGTGVAIDGSGNACVTGYVVYTVDLNPGPGIDEHTSNGAQDIFLSKFPPDGNW